jgi:sugar/nucleoside kinase (ribokinase family)
MSSGKMVRFLVIGQIRDEYIINTRGRTFQRVLGGSVLYASGSLAHWCEGIGLVASISQSFSLEWKQSLQRQNLDISGIQQIPESFDQRGLYAYSAEGQLLPMKPISAFAKAGLPVPVELLDYQRENDILREDSISTASHIAIQSLPEDYLEANLAHLCPLDLQSHIQLTTMLQKHSIRIMTLQAQNQYMHLAHWDEIPVVVKGLTAFITTEQELRELFRKRSDKLEEMVEVIGGYGCTCVVVRQIPKGYLLYNSRTKKRFLIPDYDVSCLDPTGSMDAFCGGFLSGYSNGYDPVFAAIQGSVAVSHKQEGTGPFSIKDCLPELSNARHAQLSRKVIAY